MVVPTLWSACAGRAAWVTTASLPDWSLMDAPAGTFTEFAATLMPSASASPATTLYSKTAKAYSA